MSLGLSLVVCSYDLMNDLMSAGIHRLWKDRLVTKLGAGPDTRQLDVAGGTGDIAFRALDSGAGHVTVCDINPSMLDVGRARADGRAGLTWVEGDAQQLPFPDNSFHSYTIAFGIRNVVRLEAALAEAHRVLVPGGRFLCLEFSTVAVPGLDALYELYSHQVIPAMGLVVAGDWDSYQYLVESIRQFPDQQSFAAKIEAAGFSFVEYENLTAGVAAIHSGFKL